jgi:hypothetical protein
MPPTYHSFDPAATINGESIGSVLAAFQMPQQARELLERHGLPAAPVAGNWYPMQRWLDVLAELEERFGSQSVYQAGLQVIDNSVWPTSLKDLSAALNALQTAYSANVHGHDMGYYRAEAVDACQIRVQCLTPNPSDFECGIITGLARRFKPPGAVRIRVEKQEPAPGASPHLKQFLVRW